MKKRRELPNVASLDLLWNALFGFIGMFILSLILISIHKNAQDENKIETSGEFAIVVKWPSESSDDVDTYVMDPHGNLVSFLGKSAGLMHLERDDLGAASDVIVSPDGKSVKVNKNEERVILRGILPGEYIVNLHMYHKSDANPTAATISLVKLKGNVPVISGKEVVLERTGQEATAFRFTLSKEGVVSNVNNLPRSFLGAASRRAAPERRGAGP